MLHAELHCVYIHWIHFKINTHCMWVQFFVYVLYELDMPLWIWNFPYFSLVEARVSNCSIWKNKKYIFSFAESARWNGKFLMDWHARKSPDEKPAFRRVRIPMCVFVCIYLWSTRKAQRAFREVSTRENFIVFRMESNSILCYVTNSTFISIFIQKI